ncbi:MAG: GDP-mannose 4,6-dehydratase [Hyphomicrobiales bacterium]|nr:GDP-mannose 4,6-dehydratase [Hyphomicrobiales bacterium]
MANKTALIFGVSGQDGAYLADLLLRKGYAVHGTTRDVAKAGAGGLAALGVEKRIALHSVAPTDFDSVKAAIAAISPKEIYNLSGQSSVGLSFDKPAETIDSIAGGTLAILEALRTLGADAKFFSAGSSECFGDTGDVPADEATPFHPRSPYAVAKAAAFWEVASYRDSYGLHACSGILFNHESPLRPKRFVTRKIVAGAVAIAAGRMDKLTLGDVSIRRDWGFAPDYVEAMWRMLQQEEAEDFVIATGQSHSLEEFVAAAFAEVGLDWRDHVTIDKGLMRPSELRESAGNAGKAEQLLGWRAQVLMPELVARMVAAERIAAGTAG